MSLQWLCCLLFVMRYVSCCHVFDQYLCMPCYGWGDRQCDAVLWLKTLLWFYVEVFRYEALCADFSFSFILLIFSMIWSLFLILLVFDDFSESSLNNSVLLFFFMPGTFEADSLVWGSVVVFECFYFLFCFVFHFQCFNLVLSVGLFLWYYFEDFILYFCFAAW